MLSQLNAPLAIFIILGQKSIVKNTTMKRSIGINIIRSILPLALYFAIGGAISILVAVFSGWICKISGLSESPAELVNSLSIPVTALNAVIGIYLFQWMYRKDNEDREPYTGGLTWESCIWLIALGSGVCLILNFILHAIGLEASEASYSEGIGRIFELPVWIQLIVTALIVPLAEELVFRGCMYMRMRDWLPKWPAILAVSALFGIYHGNLLQGIYAFLIGILLCIVKEQYQTIWAPVLLHISANFMAIIAQYLDFLH